MNWANLESATSTAESELARDWSTRLQRPMREALIETQIYRLTLMYHELVVEPKPRILE